MRKKKYTRFPSDTSILNIRARFQNQIWGGVAGLTDLKKKSNGGLPALTLTLSPEERGQRSADLGFSKR
jgi:hypothetical protein